RFGLFRGEGLKLGVVERGDVVLLEQDVAVLGAPIFRVGDEILIGRVGSRSCLGGIVLRRKLKGGAARGSLLGDVRRLVGGQVAGFRRALLSAQKDIVAV